MERISAAESHAGLDNGGNRRWYCIRYMELESGFEDGHRLQRGGDSHAGSPAPQVGDEVSAGPSRLGADLRREGPEEPVSHDDRLYEKAWEKIEKENIDRGL